MSNPITPPEPPLKREHIFSVRLTAVERAAIQELARQMNVSSSHLARHFLMQATSHFRKRGERGGIS